MRRKHPEEYCERAAMALAVATIRLAATNIKYRSEWNRACDAKAFAREHFFRTIRRYGRRVI